MNSPETHSVPVARNSETQRRSQTHLRLLSLLEECLLILALVLLALCEVTFRADLLKHASIHAAHIHLLTRSDHIAGVDTAEGHAIGFERASDEEDALGEGLEEDNALAAEAACEEDEDGAGLERAAEDGWAGCFAGLVMTREWYVSFVF